MIIFLGIIFSFTFLFYGTLAYLGAKGWRKSKRRKYFYRVHSNHPNKDIAGKIVNIRYDNGKTATVGLVTPILRKE